jgi:hypothetical protein
MLFCILGIVEFSSMMPNCMVIQILPKSFRAFSFPYWLPLDRRQDPYNVEVCARKVWYFINITPKTNFEANWKASIIS